MNGGLCDAFRTQKSGAVWPRFLRTYLNPRSDLEDRANTYTKMWCVLYEVSVSCPCVANISEETDAVWTYWTPLESESYVNGSYVLTVGVESATAESVDSGAEVLKRKTKDSAGAEIVLQG